MSLRMKFKLSNCGSNNQLVLQIQINTANWCFHSEYTAIKLSTPVHLLFSSTLQLIKRSKLKTSHLPPKVSMKWSGECSHKVGTSLRQYSLNQWWIPTNKIWYLRELAKVTLMWSYRYRMWNVHSRRTKAWR